MGPSLLPGAVEGPVLDGFEEMRGGDMFFACEVGEGSRHFQDAVVCACGEGKFFHGAPEDVGLGGVEDAVFADSLVRHASVAGSGAKPGFLYPTSGCDAVAHDGGGFAGFGRLEFLDAERRRLDMQVDAVEQRAGNAGAVFLNLHGGAAADMAFVAEVAARVTFRNN